MNIRPWAFWRRVQYTIGFFLVVILVGLSAYFSNYYVTPTCLDLSLNGDETGIDCGGDCVQVCEADVLPPHVVWVESFEVKEGQYNVVAYIENPNQTEGTPDLEYTFELYSGEEIVGSRSGSTVLPPNTIYPVFEGRVSVDGGNEVTLTNIVLESSGLWLPASFERDKFRSSDINLSNADDRPKLNVDIENNSLVAAEEIEVVATIFNEIGDPVTASQTFVDSISPRSTQGVVFTWPNPIAKTVRSCAIPTDVVMAIDLSGSMNNDGDNPPQPVTKALEAAGEFVNALSNAEDQVSVVTFASEAELVSQLTNLQTSVADSILSLKIKPEEESGFTNTVDAVKMAKVELISERHNSDARKVLILLTDGLPTANDDSDIVADTELEASRLSDLGIEIYSIGLGLSVDQSFIKNIASDENNAYFAPSGEDLAHIYSEITSSLCEVGPTKIEVIAKPVTNFAPIQ